MTIATPLRISAPRACRPREARRIHELLVEAIDASPHYDGDFAAFEKARFSEFFLRLLIALDPWYVCVVDNGEDIVAFSITVPEYGTLWAPWIYVTPAYRRSAAGATIIRTQMAHWQDNRFHKIACYVRPDNRIAATIFRRFGFKQIAVLERHMFGQDVILLELPRNKTLPGYDNGVAVPRARRWAIRLAMALGR